MLPDIPSSALVHRLERMLTIRRFEEGLITLAGSFDIGHFHVYIGQEATGAAALSLLEDGDMGFTTHRNHGHLLARGVEPKRMYAEILGKATGTNRGKGGTLHLASAAHGFPTTSAATGGCTPLATGAAFAFSRQGNARVSVCLFGDGALEEGSFHESINIAALESLPVIYLCENNSLEALGQKANEYPSSTMAASPLTDLAAAFGVPVSAVDGTDTGAVHTVMTEALVRARTGEGPTFIEARTVRWPGNRPLWPELLTGVTDLAMVWDDARIPADHIVWHKSQDGVLRYIRELLAAKVVDTQEISRIDEQVKVVISDSLQFALDSPFPPVEEALEDLYV